MRETYSPAFYRMIRDGSKRSAAVIVPEVVARFKPASVVDVGCGEGHFAAGFADAGCEVLGIDGGEMRDAAVPVRSVDLAEALPDLGWFDLAICLEVAEHLPPERAAGFVADLCELAPIIVFSAAVPGQGGTGHLNEATASYWVELFAEHGFEGSDELRWALWGDERICWWYRQNLLVFDRDHGHDFRAHPDVLHPEMWRHHHSR